MRLTQDWHPPGHASFASAWRDAEPFSTAMSQAILLPAAVLGIAALKVQRHAPYAAVLLALALLEHAARAPVGASDSAAGSGALRLWRKLDGVLDGWAARSRSSSGTMLAASSYVGTTITTRTGAVLTGET